LAKQRKDNQKSLLWQRYAYLWQREGNVAIISNFIIRTFVDLPTSGYDVKILILSGKYFCYNTEYSRKVFAERFKQEISPYYRRVNRCKEMLGNFAPELGGNKGATISRLARLPVSPSTILRIIERQHLPTPKVTSGVIGINDWAFKKGNTYWTIIVDLRGQLINM
jgi:transposase